ncbi:MAG: choline-sulfatase, partial [Anaerolineae bacterium]
MTTPPNILFIQTDQLTALALSSYGNSICKTPNLDKLAADGVVFVRAICNYPLCSPSRFSMLTGQLASQVGAFDNGCEFPAGQPTFVHYLRQMGYQTALSGKMHFVGPDQLHGYEERLTADIYPADFQWTASWGESETPDFVTDARIVTHAGPCANSVQIEYDNLVTFQAQQKLTKIAQDKQSKTDERPFFLTVSYTHPHDPFLCSAEHYHRYDDVEIDLPSVPKLPNNQQDPHSYRIMNNSGLLDGEFSEDQHRNARQGYYGAISYIDDQVGQLLKTLKQIKLDQNTVIIFTSDHGEMLGERGLWKKSHFFESALRVPLIMHGRNLPKGKRVSTLASLIDLFPTILSMANNGHLPDLIEPIEGADLTLYFDEEDDDRLIAAEYLGENALAPMLMVRQGDYKYLHSEGYLTMLFHVGDDPLELNNLAGLGLPIEVELSAVIKQRWNSKELSQQIV